MYISSTGGMLRHVHEPDSALATSRASGWSQQYHGLHSHRSQMVKSWGRTQRFAPWMTLDHGVSCLNVLSTTQDAGTSNHPLFFNETSLRFGNPHYISTFRNASWILGPRVDPKKYRIDECGVGKHIQYFNCVHQDFEGAGKFETQLSQKNRTKNNHSFINQPYKQNHWCWLVPIWVVSRLYRSKLSVGFRGCEKHQGAEGPGPPTIICTTTASNRHFWEDGSLRILQRQMMMIYSSPTQKHATDTRYVYTHICTYLIHICIYIYILI